MTGHTIKASLLLLLLAIATQAGLAQNRTAENVESVSSLTADVLGFTVSHEMPVSFNTTFSAGLGAYASFYNNSFPPLLGSEFIIVKETMTGGNYATQGITPYLQFGVRKYLNRYKRAQADKSLDHNAGNFILLQYALPLSDHIITDTEVLAMAQSFTAVYGIRRKIISRFFFEAGLGLGGKINPAILQLLPRGILSLNYRIR